MKEGRAFIDSDYAVSARKYLLPKPEVAGGVLYQITEALK